MIKLLNHFIGFVASFGPLRNLVKMIVDYEVMVARVFRCVKSSEAFR